MMSLLQEHPTASAILAYWLYSAFAGGMPPPTIASGIAYTWLHNSMQIAAGNLRNVMTARYPTLTAPPAEPLEPGRTITASAIVSYSETYPSVTIYSLTGEPTVSTAAVTPAPANGFVRFIDKIGKFFVKAAPVALEVAQEAEPILALTPAGPEYQVAVQAVVAAQQAGEAAIAAGTTLTSSQKVTLAVNAATPALTTILTSKGVTAAQETHITNWIQAVFNILAGPIAAKV